MSDHMLRAELDRVGPAQADLCHDFFRRAVTLDCANPGGQSQAEISPHLTYLEGRASQDRRAPTVAIIRRGGWVADISLAIPHGRSGGLHLPPANISPFSTRDARGTNYSEPSSLSIVSALSNAATV